MLNTLSDDAGGYRWPWTPLCNNGLRDLCIVNFFFLSPILYYLTFLVPMC